MGVERCSKDGGSCSKFVDGGVWAGQRAMGVNTVSHTKWLGIDYTAGARAQRKVLNVRLKKVCSRSARMKRMGARGRHAHVKNGRRACLKVWRH